MNRLINIFYYISSFVFVLTCINMVYPFHSIVGDNIILAYAIIFPRVVDYKGMVSHGSVNMFLNIAIIISAFIIIKDIPWGLSLFLILQSISLAQKFYQEYQLKKTMK